MATRFRVPSGGVATQIVQAAFQSYTHTTGAVRLPLVTADSSALGTGPFTPDAADHLAAGDSLGIQLVSAPMSAGLVFTAGDTLKFCIQTLEAHANNNLFVQIWAGVVTGSGVPLATLRTKVVDTTEFATTLTSRFFSTTLSGGYTTTGGERLVVEISASGTPSNTSGTQGHNWSIRIGSNGAGGDLLENDTQTGTTLNPWIEFVTNVTFLTASTHGQLSKYISPLE